jgi:hypothetical protein
MFNLHKFVKRNNGKYLEQKINSQKGSFVKWNAPKAAVDLLS